MAKLAQIVLRIDDEHGHHIIRHHPNAQWPYTIEGYNARPDNYLKPPVYYFPIDAKTVEREFAKAGKEFRF